jgi:phospholipid/cholesterol/gamma-HCH transport system substrate-binding protein
MAWLSVLAALALACSGCNLSLQSLPKFSGRGGNTYQVKATFDNVLNLPAEAQVLAGSAVVGAVGSITTTDFKANLVLDIDNKVRLPVGTTAQVRFASPLGDEFVTLQTPPGKTNGPFLTSGAVLAEQSTSSAPSIEDALAALSTVLNGGGINQIETIVSNLNQAFGGNQGQIRDVLTQLDDAVTSLSGHTTAIDDALGAVSNLSRQLNQGRGAIAEGLNTIGPAVTVLANENGDVNQLLTSVDRLSTVANQVLDQGSQNLISDVHELLPVVNQLVGVDQQLAPDLANLTTFETLTPKVAPGDDLQVSLDAKAVFGGGATGSAIPPLSGVSTASSSDRSSVTELLAAGLP